MEIWELGIEGNKGLFKVLKSLYNCLLKPEV